MILVRSIAKRWLRRQGNDESRPTLRPVLGSDFAALGRRQTLGYRQPETGAPLPAPRAVHLEEPVEDMGQVLRGNSTSACRFARLTNWVNWQDH